jgi:hypothetical protein
MWTREVLAGAPLHNGRRVPAAALQLSQLQRVGLWLIAVGAFLVAASYLWQGSAGGLGGRPVGPSGTRSDRITHAIGLAGAMFVLVGSGIAGVEASPMVWVVLVSVVSAVGAVWLFAAYRLRVDSRKNRHQAAKGASSRDSPFALGAAWDVQRYERQMNWKWCLKHAFISGAKAEREAVAEIGKRPEPLSGS